METIPTYQFLIERILQDSMNEILWIVIYTKSNPEIKMDRNIYKTEAAYVSTIKKNMFCQRNPHFKKK